MIQKALYEILTTDATFMAAIGTDTRGSYKVYPVGVPNGVPPPFCVYQVTGVTPSPTKGHVSGLDISSMRLTIYDAEYLDVANLAIYARTALDNYMGTANGVTVDRIEFASASDGIENIQGTDGLYFMNLDFNCWHR